MKYKYLSEEQIKISIDRLTRFKHTKEKYLRVFSDIIISNLLEPKIKKQELLNLPAEKIRNIAEEIFNSSVSHILSKQEKNIQLDLAGVECKKKLAAAGINKIIAQYENSVFYNDEETQVLLNNNIDYAGALDIIDGSSPVNIKWLKMLNENQNLISLREQYFLKYPIEKVLLVEGLTEEILLPAFSKFIGFDFYQKGIQIIPAGGKNQVVKMYYQLIEELKIPIFLLLDRDAEENIRQIKPKLRKTDKIHLVSCGEFEDLLPKSLIIKTINNYLVNFNSVSLIDFDSSLSEVKNLENIFKSKGLHEFKKSEFAKLVRNNITEDSDISLEIREIVEEISR